MFAWPYRAGIVERGDIEVNLTGVVIGLECHGCATGGAEVPPGALATLIGSGYGAGPAKAGRRPRQEGGHRRGAVAPAAFAMAVAGPIWRGVESEGDGAAKTSSCDGHV